MSSYTPRAYTTGAYLDYQARYAETPRESDRVLVGLLRELLAGRPARVLDVGCSTGNLLRHLRAALPDVECHGVDLYPETVAACRADPALAGIVVHQGDLLDWRLEGGFDAVVTSAVVYRFADAELESALGAIARALAPGGAYVGFELLHAWEQELEIVERSALHPEGLPLVVRPFSRFEGLLRGHGFGSVDFRPFEIAVDLPRPEDPADTRTYTERTAEGRRLQLRGGLLQPWCHVVARKP